MSPWWRCRCLPVTPSKEISLIRQEVGWGDEIRHWLPLANKELLQVQLDGLAPWLFFCLCFPSDRLPVNRFTEEEGTERLLSMDDFLPILTMSSGHLPRNCDQSFNTRMHSLVSGTRTEFMLEFLNSPQTEDLPNHLIVMINTKNRDSEKSKKVFFLNNTYISLKVIIEYFECFSRRHLNGVRFKSLKGLRREEERLSEMGYLWRQNYCYFYFVPSKERKFSCILIPKLQKKKIQEAIWRV